MFDTLSYVLKSYTEEKTALDGTQLLMWCQNISKLNVKGQEFAQHTIRDLAGKFCTNSFLIPRRNFEIKSILFRS
jgi:hypothetical protein